MDDTVRGLGRVYAEWVYLAVSDTVLGALEIDACVQEGHTSWPPPGRQLVQLLLTDLTPAAK